ncbi:MAG TPA: PEP-CTERM sorting domain-containing protein [Phycisphaerae bacterium]|nr:PEP-CTERM sorting domain-containing protein [Phycisphaerae bacterium]HRW52904.1 PEP-CTERM sorting domain-containing protein [Phycisphaerae bacterium]
MKSHPINIVIVIAALFASSAIHASMIAGYDIPQVGSGYATLPPVSGGAPEVSATNMTATIPALTPQTISNHYRFTGWLSSVNTSRYIRTMLTVAPGYTLSLSDVSYSVEDLPHSATLSTFHVRTSLDGFASDVDAFTLSVPGAVTDRVTDLSGLGSITGAIEFRFYATTTSPAMTMGFSNHLPGGSGAGLPDVGQNIRFNGDVIAIPEPGALTLLGLGATIVAARRRRSVR